MPTKIYLDFQKPKPQQRYCSPLACLETNQKRANENSRDASCLSGILADMSFPPLQLPTEGPDAASYLILYVKMMENLRAKREILSFSL